MKAGSNTACPQCNGTGTMCCPACEGAGLNSIAGGPPSKCRDCDGRGRTPCRYCRGTFLLSPSGHITKARIEGHDDAQVTSVIKTLARRLEPRRRPSLPSRIEKRVYQEATSQCSFCPQREVAALEIHHIDGNPANNVFENLILACSSCHSKITARVISLSDVVSRKKKFLHPQ